MSRCGALRAGTALCLLALLGACAMAPVAPAKPPAAAGAAADLAPSGTLRAAINFGNPILAVRDPATGEARGVSVDLARELGTRLNVPVELVLFESAGNVVAGQKTRAWDVAFLAVDPARASELYFSAPYVVIEGSYLVPERSAIRANADVDKERVRVVVGAGSAYDLFLSRELKRATIIRAPTSPAVTDMLVAQNLDVAAGVKQQLEADAKRVPGVRLLEGRFMVINQAVATPRGRPAGAAFLDAFVEDMKSSGFVAGSLARHGIAGAAVAPAAAR
jgi:polar amino acid transport system substrate-binding protein